MVLQLLVMSAILGATTFGVGMLPLSYTFSSTSNVIFYPSQVQIYILFQKNIWNVFLFLEQGFFSVQPWA